MISTYWKSFVSIFFPELCAACNTALYNQEKLFCTSCTFHLPYTKSHLLTYNLTERKLWGKVEFVVAHSIFYLSGSSLVNNIIQKVKYQNQPTIAYEIGKIYGAEIKHLEKLETIDCLVPIPLHRKKERQRGYNQSYYLAKGLAESLNKPIRRDLLIRTAHTKSQTTKSRTERYENVENVFYCPLQDINIEHVLIIDDVITTGATLSSAGKELIKRYNCTLSFITLALA